MTHEEQIANESTIPFAEHGTGETVLLLHGGGGPESIPSLITTLAADHHVLVPTHPGWHGTVRPADLDSVPKLASQYLEILRARGEERVVVVGSSFGGWIAAEMAVQTDTRISGLILIDAVGIEPDPTHIPVRNSTATRTAPNPGQSPEAFAAIQAYTGTQMWDATLASRLNTVSVPALVVWGAHDPVLTADYGRALAAAMPGTRFALIDDAGHLPSEEQPDATTSVVTAFLHAVEQK